MKRIHSHRTLRHRTGRSRTLRPHILRPLFYAACGLLGPLASTAQAHFLWANVDKGTVRISFAEGADGVTTDVPLDRIATAKAWSADKKELTLKTDGAARSAALPAGPKVAGAAQTWGVLDKNEQGRGVFLLEYGAKAAQSLEEAGQSVGSPLELFAKAAEGPDGGGPDGGAPTGAAPRTAIVTLLHDGKAVADNAISIHEPGVGNPKTLTTDAEGHIKFSIEKPGIYGLRAGIAETKSGAYDGKKYDLVRRYATLTFNVAPVQTAAAKVDPRLAAAPNTAPNGEGNSKADPAAYALLKAAHENRQVVPDDFTGFTADVAFYDDDKSYDGTLVYHRKGKTEIKFDKLDAKGTAWVEEKLMNLIGHRRGGDFAKGDGRNPLSFGKEPDNSFGKLIELNDGLHSSYRVQDNKVTEVTRIMGGMRFTISVIETREADPGKYLANHFIVTYRDEKTNTLKKFEGYRDTYAQFGQVWLPVSRAVVEVGEATTPNMRLLRLRNIKVLPAGSDKVAAAP